MLDGVVYCRTLAGRLQEAVQRLGPVGRRWREAADAARTVWDDAAGREVFQRWLAPYDASLTQAERALQEAAGRHDTALARAQDAAAAAEEAARHTAQALGTARDVTARAVVVRSEAAAAHGDANFANGLAQQVLAAVNSLGD